MLFLYGVPASYKIKASLGISLEVTLLRRFQIKYLLDYGKLSGR